MHNRTAARLARGAHTGFIECATPRSEVLLAGALSCEGGGEPDTHSGMELSSMHEDIHDQAEKKMVLKKALYILYTNFREMVIGRIQTSICEWLLIAVYISCK